MQGQYNMRSPAVKRLMKEAQELREATEQYYAQPLEDNLFEWHFTLRGPADSEFENGVYHGRIILPPDYPMKPPSIILLTPNGRFELFKKICLSISGHHPESWQPSWSIRTALLAIIGFMPTHGAGALGSLDYTPEERKFLAKKSQEWRCPTCGDLQNVLLPVTEASKATEEEAKRLAAQIDFQGEKEKTTSSDTAPSATAISSTPPPEAAPNAQPHPAFPFQMPFGQMPFNRFQMPFPMMPPNPPGGNNNSTSHVPRFPMPFMPPMVPGFNPAAGTNPFMVGNHPMFPPNVRTTVPCSTGETLVPSGSPYMAPVTSASAATPTLPAAATPTLPSTATTLPIASVSSSNVPMASTPELQTNSSAQPKTTSTSSVTTAASMTAPSQSEGLRQRSVAPPTQSEGLRQRNASAPGLIGQNAEISDRPQSRGTASMVVMVILAVAISLLCLRRVILSGLWR